MSRGSKRRFDIFNISAEPERPKPTPHVRPRRFLSVREPPTSRGKLTTAQRLKMMVMKNSNRITNSYVRQKLEREKALACRRILVRRKQDPNLVLDLTRDAPLGNQTNTQNQPDELVSDDDEDEQDFAQMHTARTLFHSPERDASPHPHTKPSTKHRRSTNQITELLGDENLPRSRLKKRRINQQTTTKRVSIPVSSSVFAPNVQNAMRLAKSEHSHRPHVRPKLREPFKSVNRQDRISERSSTVSTKQQIRPCKDVSATTTCSRQINLTTSTTSTRANDLREVYEISDDDEDFAESDTQVRNKHRTHPEASITHRGKQHASKRPRATRQEDRRIPTSTFYGSGDRKKHDMNDKERSPRVPLDEIARLKIKNEKNSGDKPLHKVEPEKPYRKHLKGKLQYESSEEDDESTEAQIDPRFRPLSGPELEVVRSLTFKVSKNKVMAKIPEANIELKAGDFSCLRGSRWLNDEIMNSFVALINARNATQVVSTSKPGLSKTDSRIEEDDEITEVAVTSSKPMEVFRRPRPRTHLFNTFFYTRLSQHGYDYSGVRRWLKRAGKKVTDLDLIMVPINLSNFHWVLAAIDLRGKQFLYLDSTFGKDSYDTISLLRRWLHDEVSDKDGESAAADMQIDTWGTIVNPAYLPQQRDDGSCGIFTLYMAEYLERGMRPDFNQEKIRTLRQRTALFLKRGKLPDA